MEIKMNESFAIDDVLTWKDRAEFGDYLDKEGYFADNLNDLAWNIHKDAYSILEEVNYEATECFGDEDEEFYSMFLPKDKVHFPEVPKTRPFKSMEEFMKDTGLKVGDVIYLRNTSDEPDQYVIRLITGLNNDCVIIGHTPLFFNTLFDLHIFSTDGHTWKGFVHVEEQEVPTPVMPLVTREYLEKFMLTCEDTDDEYIGTKGWFFDADDIDIIMKVINNDGRDDTHYGLHDLFGGCIFSDLKYHQAHVGWFKCFVPDPEELERVQNIILKKDKLKKSILSREDVNGPHTQSEYLKVLQHVDKEGYFGINEDDVLGKIKTQRTSVLKKVDCGTTVPYQTKEDSCEFTSSYAYFIPKSIVDGILGK